MINGTFSFYKKLREEKTMQRQTWLSNLNTCTRAYRKDMFSSARAFAGLYLVISPSFMPEQEQHKDIDMRGRLRC